MFKVIKEKSCLIQRLGGSVTNTRRINKVFGNSVISLLLYGLPLTVASIKMVSKIAMVYSPAQSYSRFVSYRVALFNTQQNTLSQLKELCLRALRSATILLFQEVNAHLKFGSKVFHFTKVGCPPPEPDGSAECLIDCIKSTSRFVGSSYPS